MWERAQSASHNSTQKGFLLTFQVHTDEEALQMFHHDKESGSVDVP